MAHSQKSGSTGEKPNVDLVEDAEKSHHLTKHITGFDADASTVPPGYFRTANFWGSLTAIGMSFGSAVGQFALPAPILTTINNDIGPNTNIAWVSYVAVLGIAVGLPITARYSDIFGRRWFVIIEQFIMAIGAIVGAISQNVPTLIGATAIMSTFSGGAYSYSYLANEITPMKYRFVSTSFCIIFAVPFSGFAPEVAGALALTSGRYGGWRWCYWLMAMMNIVSTLLLLAFYYPPTFKMKHTGQSKRAIMKKADYIGLVIFTAGITVFILGLSWGGTTYPWKSAAVIVSIVGGAVALGVFAFWETRGPPLVPQPFTPPEIFKDRDWVVGALLLSFGASIYYAFALVWPQAVIALYSNNSPAIQRILTCCAGIPYNGGQVSGGFLSEKIGKLRLQLIVACGLGTILLGCLAAVKEQSSSLGLLIVGVYAFGWNEGVTQTLVGICVQDQKEIGIAVGIAGSIRSTISTIWSSVFVTVLDNRLRTTIPNHVTPAVVNAGLPRSSVPALLQALTSGKGLDKVPDLTPAIREAAIQAYRVGSKQAFNTVYLVSIAVGGSLFVLSLFCPNVDHLMDGKLAVTVHSRKDERALEEEAGETPRKMGDSRAQEI